jgi:hypothetical protein
MNNYARVDRSLGELQLPRSSTFSLALANFRLKLRG